MIQTKLSDKFTQERRYAVSFGLLAAGTGVLAGGTLPAMVALGALFAALYLMAESRGWLRASADGRTGRDYGVTLGFAVLVTAFVYLTGGLRSPMPCSLYLPILLAALCYGLRVGLTAAVGMIGVAAVLAMDGHLPGTGPSQKAIAIGLSFFVVAVFGAALRAQMERRLSALDTEKKNLSVQLDMSQMMESAFDLDMTLNLILLNIQEHFPCAVCAVYLKGRDGKTLELRAASGSRRPVGLLPSLSLREAFRGGLPMPGENGVRAFQMADTSLYTDPSSVLRQIDKTAASFVCLPLASVEVVLGMLYISADVLPGLSPENVTRLEQLAARAAFPLQRVLVQQDFRSMAYSDAMTGLDNFRQFEETLSDELLRAERYERPLSVILLDIDHFKSFNDTRGHQAGDALLGQLGVVLRNALRNVDRPARYGGEEFVIICPETGADEALLIAERIRLAVQNTPFILPGKDGGEADTARVTVSLGCATFPRDAHADRDLVKRADLALYAAKGAGRNCVRAYTDSDAQAVAAG